MILIFDAFQLYAIKKPENNNELMIEKLNINQYSLSLIKIIFDMKRKNVAVK